MGMFDKYDKLNPDYIPDNSSQDSDDFDYTLLDNDLPRTMYDALNRFIGYTWNHNESFDFVLSVNDTISIKKDSIIYNEPGKCPNKYTVANREGQQAYNIVDAKSWTYIGRADSLYVWVEDDVLTYPIDGDKTITVNTDMTDKYIQLDIFNFRWEKVHSTTSANNESIIVLKIDEEMHKKLPSGIYYITLKICSEDSVQLKDKFMVSIN